MRYFETLFLKEADEFLESIERKAKKKVLFNVRVAEQTNDSGLFKKLNPNIWEFKTRFHGQQIRLLAFWDKKDKSKTLVLACSGFIKKTQKTPKKEIKKAELIRERYFKDKGE